jgi:ATP-dependent DNA helicase PIF1
MCDNFLNTTKPIKVRSVPMKKKQAHALALLENGESVFLTGPGGVGKTAVLRTFATNCSVNVAITSTTGTSALLLNGTTLHSFLGIGLGKESVKRLVTRINNQNWLRNRWSLLDCLVIDEISMMHPDLFDKLEEVARVVRNDPRPFGGVQLAISGDFLQLPCIGTMNFCFQAKSWNKCVPNVVYLDEIIRQGDKRFQKCLNAVRLGNITKEVRAILDTRVGARLSNDHGIRPTKLYAKNVDVQKENDIELDKLAEEGREFFAYEMDIEIHPDLLRSRVYMTNKFKKYCPVSERIELCVGAQVMLVKNIDLYCGLANGSRGVVMGFNSANLPIVRFLNGEERVIGMELWEMDDKNMKALRAHQIPLRVAYAISIHKSQGCSLDYAEIDLSEVFEYGQAYVALSRVKSLHGLSIIDINYDCIQADPLAVSYYEKLH